MVKTSQIAAIASAAAALLLAGCNPPASAPDRDAPSAAADSPDTPASAAPPPAVAANARPSAPRSCAAEIGPQAAASRAALCRKLSPATHPPCHTANSCAMIDDEIARSCTILAKDGALPADCRPDPKSTEAAVAVIERYYAALDARDYPTAWRQWGADGPPKQTLAAFTAGFAHTASTRVTVGAPGPGEGAAGSIYLTVPVTVEAALDSGQAQRFSGEYVLRRVNDVDGADTDQLRWHIASAKLAPR